MLAAAALALVAFAAPAGAAPAPSPRGVVACTQAKPGQLYVTLGTANYYVAAPNVVSTDPAHPSTPRLKTFTGNAFNSTATFVRCYDSAGTTVAFEYSQARTTWVLRNDKSDGFRVIFAPVPTGGAFLSENWGETVTGVTSTFSNKDSGNFLRVSNQGVCEYCPVVAGASATSWSKS
jgi:hypothetical protein